MTSHALTDLELTLLGIVAEGARYGNELEQVIANRGLRDWLVLGSASTYYVLERLEAHALLAGSVDETGQRVYQITDAGRGVLQTAVVDLIGRRRSLSSIGLGLANLHVLRPHQVLSALKRQQGDLRAGLSRLTSLAGAAPPDSTSLQIMIAYETTVMQAELTWLEGFIAQWRGDHPTLRETDETQPVRTPNQAQTGDQSASPTVVHRRTDVHQHKQAQAIRRPRQDEGGSTQ